MGHSSVLIAIFCNLKAMLLFIDFAESKIRFGKPTQKTNKQTKIQN